jgi:hypothetical protein
VPSDFQGSPSPGIPGPFIALFVIFAIVGVGSAIWRFSVLRRGGLNPFVATEQIEAKLAQSRLLQPPPTETTKEQRLAEIDDLYQRGVISADEHVAGRAKIISGD